jgi:hypothetical protein
MLFFRNLEEPPLHKALLQQAYDHLEKLCSEPGIKEQVNLLGFTALEIAYLLNDTKAIALLNPDAPTFQIPMVLRGSSQKVLCTLSQFERLFQVQYRSHLYFPNYSLLCKVIHECPWILAKSSWGDTHRALGTQYRSLIQSGTISNVYIEWIDKKLGYGICALENLAAEQCIGSYTGLVRPLKRLYPDINGYCFHYPTRFFSWNYFVIDALHRGNALRFINHSDQPNLTPAWALDRGLLHLLLITTRSVAAGDRLTFNYGEDYWKYRRPLRGNC